MPQSSVLGPVLFLRFINVLPLFTVVADVDMYADDTTVHVASKDCKTVKNKRQNSASGFKCWCLSNKMYVNIPKTTGMTLGSRQNLNRNEAFEIYIEGQLIQSVEQQKRLGVVIDRRLTWHKQIDAVCLNISCRITLLKLFPKMLTWKY